MIIKLHKNLVNKIAAGEVVERPASVVKELIENAIDAKATRIDVRIEDAGLKSIQVGDNGSGMSEEDALIACDPHTTSKITTIQDLDSINTMGFRGEALSSISSVSDLTLITKQVKDKIGSKLIVQGGKKGIEGISVNPGTTITVERLFHTVPARRKFLKSSATEYKHILSVFESYALAFPNIYFKLTCNNRIVHDLPSVDKADFNDELFSRISDLYGSAFIQDLVALNYSGPQIQLKGFISHPRLAQNSRAHQSIFLNKRPIYDHLISKAILDSYHTLIPRGKYPIFFLFMSIDPRSIDVNIHPRKLEVRFSQPQEIYKAVYTASRQTMLKFLQKDVSKAVKEFPQAARVNQTRHDRNAPLGRFDAIRPHKFQIKESLVFSKALLSNRTPSIFQGDKEDSQQPMTDSATLNCFQLFNSVILIEKSNKILFIDQHAASERVTFERLSKEFQTSSVSRQRLLIPEIVELSAKDFQILKEHRDFLAKVGITLSIFGDRTYKVEEIPALIANADIKALIRDILGEIDNDDMSEFKSLETEEEKVIATIACHTSIRSGMRLVREQMNDLVSQLLTCKVPYSCPHGRPIIWELSRTDLMRKFKRP